MNAHESSFAMQDVVKDAIRRLNEIIEKRELSVAEVARRSNLPQPTAHRILSEQSSDPRLSNLQALANGLGVKLTDLFGLTDPTHGAIREPQSEYIASSSVPMFTLDDLADKKDQPLAHVQCPVDHSASTFAIKLVGDPTTANPMQPAYGRAYPVGSVVFADPALAATAKHGDIVIAQLKDRPVVAFRQLYREAGSEALMPLNPQFPANTEPFEVIAKVIGAVLP